MFRYVFGILALGVTVAAAVAEQRAALPTVLLPKSSLEAEELAVIVNRDDPLSVAIGEYYRAARNLPAANVISVRFAPGKTVMTRVEFERVKRDVHRQTPKAVQAYALTWAQPYRVDCMSITSAFAFGFDPAHCASGCRPTKPSPYFHSASEAPYGDYRIRPTMTLAAARFDDAKRLIDRGVRADHADPEGTAYLIDTSDAQRNVRAAVYDELIDRLRDQIAIERVRADYLTDKRDVLFYFTGRADVPGLETLRFVPGAIADHLTSSGGQLTDSGQMSSLKWLEAGATGSYGAVVEPCNFPGKFPDPRLVMSYYLAGASLIEAYWKSVQMPGQGIFIGEPLARPFGGVQIAREGDGLILRTWTLRPGRYGLYAIPAGIGRPRAVARDIAVGPGRQEIRLPAAAGGFYRLVPEAIDRDFTSVGR